MTKKYSYREKMYHDLRDKLRNNEDVTITDLSSALWLYEKAFDAYEKMFNDRIEAPTVYREIKPVFTHDEGGKYGFEPLYDGANVDYRSHKPSLFGGPGRIEKGIWIFLEVEE
ncbi:hypothetical protein GXD45_13055 [Listeria monocytogenes]|uniref:hypothetical protein n=1 Tax=Listeria monocytogenes TaxID=1639 RepID=UPI000BDE8FDF|nr:hypothetical protein [Listeria monocytogenes]EDN9223203.1 hypothetical protein [Listeria monocytogenes]MBV1135794.1 hypothetical protein [Listeria monocytogenes]PCW38099.1 hypothetical protein A7O02_13105 [Listeria monocytogenes]HBJ9287059.1 hypothetical protein [Listeria monocytogenes]HDT9366306.1 hypothetical protein [Listeria monocytogenes]